MTTPHDLRLLGLLVENVKRVKLVHIQPRAAAGVVEIAGNNGSGKSSTLDALMYALGGKGVMPPKPLRTGATKGSIVVELADKSGAPVLKITRSLVPTDSHIAVERIGGGGKMSKPQEFLDVLAGAGLGFDPLAFMRKKPKEQVEQLLGLVKLPIDPRTLDQQRAELYTERTTANRDAKRLEAMLNSLPVPDDTVPDDEVSVEALLAEQQTMIAQRDARAVALRQVQDTVQAAGEAAKLVDRLLRELADAEHRLAVARDAVNVADAALAALPEVDLSDITARLGAADYTNAAVRRKQQRRAYADEYDAKQRWVDALSRRIIAIDEQKTQMLASAAFPIPGLGFELVGNDYVVTFMGAPLEQCSQSEQIKVGLAIAMALSPGVRVVLIRDGSLLDEASRALVDQMATEQGYHVLMEVVGDGDPGAFVLEDGGLRDVPAADKARVAW